MSWKFAIVLALSASALCLAQNARPATVPPGAIPAEASSSTNSGAQAQTTTDSPSAQGQTIQVQLAKTLDAKKLKVGDPVEARTVDDMRMADGTIVPRGSKVSGHITKAEARAKGNAESQLGISFDQIATKDGKGMTLKSTIQAVGPPPRLRFSALDDRQQQVPGAPGSGQIGAANPPVGIGPQPSYPSNPAAGATPPPPPDTEPEAGQLTPQSTGVLGLHDLQLEPGSILASGGKNVKLEAGSQILLQVQNQ